MDPDECLERIRELFEEMPEVSSDVLDALADHFQALDEWLCKGGFLPKDWRSANKSR